MFLMCLLEVEVEDEMILEMGDLGLSLYMFYLEIIGNYIRRASQ